MSRRVGYVRLISPEGDVDAESDMLRDSGAEDVVIERDASGGLTLRDQMIGALESGDLVLVSRSIHLALRLTDFVSTVASLGERSILFRSLAEPALSTHTGLVEPGATFLALDALRAEFISVRTKNGLQNAAARGRRPGRPTVMTPELTEIARELRLQQRSISHIAHVIGVSPSAVRRALLLPSD